jgi:organic hydroperoxide reductase OsmC/OhrA
MRNQTHRHFQVNLRHDTGYQFVGQASEDGRQHGEPFRSDEPDPVGDAAAPATPALLGAAVGHCLSASLLETLRHAHIDVEDVETEAVSVVALNAEGLPRIDHVRVTIRPVLRAPNARTQRCADVFEKHCTVTSSVRSGIDVRVAVEWQYATDQNGADAAHAVAPAGVGERS